MRRLISGIVEFRERQLSKYAERFRDLALAQSPDALIVTCSDSRVVPDLLASTHPGDLFTMRNQLAWLRNGKSARFASRIGKYRRQPLEAARQKELKRQQTPFEARANAARCRTVHVKETS